MRKAVYRVAALSAIFLTACVSFAGGNDVLYWMIDDTAKVTVSDGNGSATTLALRDFLNAYTTSQGESWTDSNFFAARIRVGGGDISGDTFLSLYGLDENNQPYFETSGMVAFNEDGETGYWGAGVPDGNQSPSGDFSAGTPEYTFTVEIGNVLWDAVSEEASWVESVAWSSAATAYSSLGDYIHETFDLTPGQLAVWTPTAFVPEPTSGLLTAIGFALLALRRKRQ